MLINGKEMQLTEQCTLGSFLIREGYVIGRVAVEKNGDVVPKARYDTETLCDSDILEIVTFVGGG